MTGLAYRRALRLREEFAAHMIALRGSMSLTQKGMADALGISPQYVNDLERARRGPSTRICDKLAELELSRPRGLRALDPASMRQRWHIRGAQAHGWEV